MFSKKMFTCILTLLMILPSGMALAKSKKTKKNKAQHARAATKRVKKTTNVQKKAAKTNVQQDDLDS